MKLSQALKLIAVSPLFMAGSVYADATAAKKWVDQEFTSSTLTPAQQMEEMNWFINAAKPYKG